MSDRKAFLIYREWAIALSRMPEEQAGELIKAICSWEVGEEYQIQDPTISAVFDGWMLQLQKDADNYRDISESRRKAAESRWHKEPDALHEDASACKCIDLHSFADDVHANKNNNKNNNKDIKEKSIKREKFQRPSVDEVSEYCKFRSNNVNPERFVDYYDSVGWKVGNKPMKDWKAAVRTWEQRSKQTSGIKKPSFNHIEQHDYDFDELEKALGG